MVIGPGNEDGSTAAEKENACRKENWWFHRGENNNCRRAKEKAHLTYIWLNRYLVQCMCESTVCCEVYLFNASAIPYCVIEVGQAVTPIRNTKYHRVQEFISQTNYRLFGLQYVIAI